MNLIYYYIIKNLHDDNIYYINIKDKNNFVSIDKNIKTWIKRGNEFKKFY